MLTQLNVAAPSFAESLEELTNVISASKKLEESVLAACSAIKYSILNGGKLISCGNGGSAADALHLSEELVGRFKAERRSLPAICLNADVTAITCIGNDYGFDAIYSRQLEGLGKPGDVLVGFSTSGNSPNIIEAFAQARKQNIITIYLGGKNGGTIKGTCDHEIIIPSNTTARIQEMHTLILHQWLEELDITDWSTLNY
ncbi:SIS domain-containing protein [Mucilaginibacter sp. OK283]|jgi:D-sedoheptulose 7-phosphate isomerase|uniref:D-sedoheptulose-7-phosphate isomerase n=1 Tax=Mucilaginibacter sp. OK283 TaxID=1881049 RepID=UPI0008BB7F94|nr:SIS domain-containing protein [Mucilaginibacter sp. OK283]SEP40126.1 phosphoheptose isomerase [Mucilaginibacter sp. OK283]